ncbi:hypothetical protein AOQ84DRAFT_367150 [Glonium stellatum]|uniref:Fungal N-terminal domain-containing protein n=1 Tax=Glonium stellatum TaxID=574774 RepID=A0A8E2EU19_9PEZI|nr:hypothetical protein AOQ84DRAFT_367150 [Glonium stellatum]
MDPLSVSASVIALIGAGGKIVSLLSRVTAIADAPALAAVTLTEMTDISTALRHIQDFINGTVKVPIERQQNILVEHIIATLTGCLKTYSELEKIVDSLNIGLSGMSVFDRVKWTAKEASIRTIVLRLQNHKSSLSLMLSILQSTSIIEVRQTVTRLHGLMEELLCGDDDLYRRLSSLRTRALPSGASNIESILHDNTNDVNDDGDNTTIRPMMTANRNTMENFNKSTIGGFAFDGVLAKSRVYSRLTYLHPNTHSEMSLTSSTRRVMATTLFSATSLAEISNISIYSLPIYNHEVSNYNSSTKIRAPAAPSLPRVGVIQLFVNNQPPSPDQPADSRPPSPGQSVDNQPPHFYRSVKDRPPTPHPGNIDQHVKKFHKEPNNIPARRIISEIIRDLICPSDCNENTTISHLRETIAAYCHNPTDDGCRDSLERICTLVDQIGWMIDVSRSVRTFGSFGGEVIFPGLQQDGVEVKKADLLSWFI